MVAADRFTSPIYPQQTHEMRRISLSSTLPKRISASMIFRPQGSTSGMPDFRILHLIIMFCNVLLLSSWIRVYESILTNKTAAQRLVPFARFIVSDLSDHSSQLPLLPL